MTYKATMKASFTGYITQAIVNNFAPLLFVTFQHEFQISLSKVTMLVTVNFITQLIVDFLAIFFIDRIGYRLSAIFAHFFCGAGLVSLMFIPGLFSEPFIGLLISVVIYAIGGGILEVIVSPIVESCPTDNKKRAMSLLHSFYCWGHVGVVLISTLYFFVFGISNWKFLALIWAFVPFLNMLVFTKVPMFNPEGDANGRAGSFKLFKNKNFWLLMLIMVCAGASEHSISQWGSAFAEQGLGISKVFGDIFGPTLFATCMGITRIFYGKYGEKINLNKFMLISGVLCVCSFLLTSLSPIPALSIVGCAMSGLAVGIMWPGTFSTATVVIKGGATTMFAFLALAGDVGCSLGPTVVGLVSDYMDNDLKKGILASVIFPIVLTIGISCAKRISNKKEALA
ncbi:MAG: MFS transporter [Suipraeoptans sp.]